MKTLLSSRLWTIRPAVRLVLLYASGIVISAYLSISHISAAPLFLICFTLWIVLEGWPAEQLKPRRGFILACLYLLMWPLLGYLNHEQHQQLLEREQSAASRIALFSGETLQMAGDIKDAGRTTSGRKRLDLRVDQVRIGQQTWREPITVRLYLDDAVQPEYPLMTGERLNVLATLSELDPPTNPGQFDYREWLNRQGIFLHGELTTIIEREDSGGWFSRGRLQSAVYDRISDLFDHETEPVARPLLTGDRSLLDSTVEQAFSRSGLAHMMAVSGLHVGFIASPFWLLMLRTPHGSLWRWMLFGLLSLTLFTYSAIAGFTASVCRASLMAWMISGGQLVRRRGDPLNMLAASALIILLVDPSQLFGVGFQLSYSAVSVILLSRPLLNRPGLAAETRASGSSSVRFKALLSQLYQLITISAVVQTGLLPLLIWYFGELSLSAPLSNLLVLPVLTLLVPWSMLLVAVSDLIPELVQTLNAPARWGVTWIRQCALLFGSWRHGWISADITEGWTLPLWCTLMAAVAAAAWPAQRVRLLISLFVLLNLFALHRVIETARPAELVVTVLDVGQADAIHIQTPGDRHLLVDTGRWSPYGDSGSRVLLPWLEANRIRYIDAIILTHPHADHIGGVVTLLQSENVEVGAIWHSGYSHDSQLWRRVIRTAEETGVPLPVTGMGSSIDIDPAIRLFVLGPDSGARFRGPNDNSVVLRLVYGETSMLLAGDAEQLQEQQLVQTFGDFLESDLLKVSHHGSRTSSTHSFLSRVRPERAAVSLDLVNRFNHPHREAVERLAQWSGEIDFTSLEGALQYRSDGESLQRFE